jgi:tripartite-type tricarboxylate transporter receptor subunit TctC
MKLAHLLKTACTLAALAGLTAAPAAAQDFYKGKTVTIVVGFSPGGGFDLNARLLARHIGKYIPGTPTVIVQNMPGAGSLTSVRHLQSVAPKDGTVISTFNFGLIAQSRLTPDKVPIDFRKFAWIGSISQDLSVCYVWHTLNVKDLADLKTRKNIHFGLTVVGANEDIQTRILKSIFGVDVHQVSGYPGSAEERLAVERGELEGGCGAWSSIPEEWIKSHLIKAVYRSADIVPPDMPKDVPYMMELAPNDRARDIIRVLVSSGDVGRPYIVTQEVPVNRINMLREAFGKAVKDPDFIADAKKQRLPVSPKIGDQAAQTVEAIYATPDDVVAEARKIVTQ